MTATPSVGAATVSRSAPSSSGRSPIQGYTVNVIPSPTPPDTITVTGTTTSVSGLADDATDTFAVAAFNATVTGPAASNGPVTSLGDSTGGTANPTLVQSFAYGANAPLRQLSASLYTFNVPNTWGAGNCVVVIIDMSSGNSVSSLVDDVGNSWPTTPAVSADNTSSMLSAVYVLANVDGGGSKFTLNLTKSDDNVKLMVLEFSGVATTAAVGVTSQSSTARAPSVTAPALTPAAGSLVLHYGLDASARFGLGTPVTSITAGAGWTLLHADFAGGSSYDQSMNWYALQWQLASGGSITPTFATTGTHIANTWALELEASPGAGSAPDGGIHINKVQVFTQIAITQSTYHAPFPTTGNLTAVLEDNGSLRAVPSDSTGNSWALPVVGNSAPVSALAYAKNVTPSQNNVIALPVSGLPQNTTYYVFDISGADATAPLLQTVTFPVALETLSWTGTCAITPTTQGSLILNYAGTGNGPVLSETSPLGAAFLIVSYPSQTDQDTFDNANAMSSYYNLSSPPFLPLSFGYTMGHTTTINATAAEFLAARKPSAATLANYVGEHDGTASRVTWSAQDSQNLGFRVWREGARSRELVTPGLIAGFALRARVERATGHSYLWNDPGAPNGGTFWIEAIDVQGRSDWTGPIITQKGTAFSGVPAAPLLGRSSRLSAALASPTASARVGSAGVCGSPNRALQWQLAGMAGVKLQVQGQGVFHVTAEQLFGAGIPRGAAVGSLSLWANSQAVSFNVLSADGVSLQTGDAIELYGVGLDTYYTDTQIYWLTTGLGEGQRMITAAEPPSSFKAESSFLETLVNPQHSNYTDLPGISLSNRFYGSVLTTSYGLLLSDQESFSTPLIDQSSSSPSTLAVGIQGLTPGPHAIDVLLNGTSLGSVTGTGVELMSGSFTPSPGLLLPGSNQVELVPRALPGNSQPDVSGVASEALTYPRLFANGGGPLQFTAPAQSTVSLTGFASGARILDVTNPLDPEIVAVQPDPASGALLVHVPGQGIRALYAFQPSDLQALDVVPNVPSAWHSVPGADLVIVAHASLLASIQPLVAQREDEGFKVVAVDIQDVYDEFGSGEKSANALRSFLQFASTSWGLPPSYVLLVGNGTYDPRGYFGSPELDLVPVLQVDTSQMYTASDDAFVNFAGQSQAVAIGRLPLRNAADTAAAVQKILGRTLTSPSASFLFVYGAPRFAGEDFGADTWLVKSVVSSWPSQEFGPLPDGGVDASVHASVISAMKAGPAVVTYEGHGLEDAWYPSTIFSGADVAALAGTGTAAVFIAGTCLNGYFLDAEPASESLTEELLRTEAGGAWAVWSSTGETSSNDHARFSARLLQAAAVQGTTLGKATLAAKASESDPNVRAVFQLFGDPSSRLAPANAASTSFADAGEGPSRVVSGCGTPGSTGLSLLPLIFLPLLLRARGRRSANSMTIETDRWGGVVRSRCRAGGSSV